MEKKEKIQNIWALTDKPLIDIMKKKTQPFPTAFNKDDSSDETSDSGSESNNDFIALPEEFRPHLNIKKPCPERKDEKISLNQTSEKLVIYQSPTATSKISIKNTLANRFPKNHDQTSSLRSNEEALVKDNASSVLKADSKISYEVVKKIQGSGRAGEMLEKDLRDKGKILSKKKCKFVSDTKFSEQQSAVSNSEEFKNKKPLIYEYVQKQERRAIELNFDTLKLKGDDSVLKEGLKYETKFASNTDMYHKNVTRDKSRMRKGNARGKSSLLNTQFSVSSKQTSIKWDSSLNLNCAQDGKIEWTFIQKETSVRKLVTSKQFSNEFFSGNNHANRAISRNSPRGKLNNSPHNINLNYQDTKPKTIQKRNLGHTKSFKLSSGNLSFKNNVLSGDNNTFKYPHILRNSDSSSDSESLDMDEDNWRIRHCMINRQDAENVLFRSSPEVATNTKRYPTSPILVTMHKETSDVESHFHENSKHKNMLLPNRNKQRGDFAKNQRVKDNSNLPEGLKFSRRENLDAKLSRDLEEKRESILWYGKEMSDLIIGSYDALNIFISFYREWTIARRELITHFEELGNHLKESSKKFSKWTDVIKFVHSGAAIATAIPHPAAAIAARIVTVITSLVQTFVKAKTPGQANIDDSDDIGRAMLKDTNTTYDLYLYGLQCSQQFEETTKLIKKFHSNADIQEYVDNENPEITTFIRGLLEFKPNHRIFYKKLQKCFQELLQTSATKYSKNFCEPFTLYSSPAVDVIEHLEWRFHNEDFDGSSVRYEVEEIHRSIQNSSSADIGVLHKRIQNCTAVLIDELEFMESRTKGISLFHSFSDNSKLYSK